MPKIVDHDQYRRELLGKSFDLFAQKGYAAITMRQIAQGLGIVGCFPKVVENGRSL